MWPMNLIVPQNEKIEYQYLIWRMGWRLTAFKKQLTTDVSTSRYSEMETLTQYGNNSNTE